MQIDVGSNNRAHGGYAAWPGRLPRAVCVEISGRERLW